MRLSSCSAFLALLTITCTQAPKSKSVADTREARDSAGGTDGSASPPATALEMAASREALPATLDPAARSKLAADSAVAIVVATQPKSRTRADSFSLAASIRAGLKNPGWPVRGPDPLSGSILPGKRIVAFYGNPLSKRMGILGEIPYDQMLAKLDTVVGEWRAADPATPVQPALHLIVSVAQGQPGKDGMHRQRSDPDLIEKIYGFARSRGAIMILDIQAGKSTIDSELPLLLPFSAAPRRASRDGSRVLHALQPRGAHSRREDRRDGRRRTSTMRSISSRRSSRSITCRRKC